MKKIKTLLALLCLACILPLSFLNNSYAKAQSAYDEMDRLFQSTLSEIFDYENIEEAAISAEKEMLYDINLNPLGILYRFDYQNKQGYAIVINDGFPSVTEISTDSPAPYDENENKKIYVSLGMYWYYDGVNFYDNISGLKIDGEAFDIVSETAFFGAVEFQYATEQVSYLYRSETKYRILSSIPDYTYGLENGCAAVAGTNLIAYYDKIYTNLIPNYDPGSLFLGIYRFKTENTNTMNLTDNLHKDMKTNVAQAGTTIPQFKTGMASYVNRQGYSISFTNLMILDKINYESVKNVVQNEKVIALFLSGFRTVKIVNENGYDILSYEYTKTNHVAAGFGCLEVNYTLSNNQIRTDKYIHCSMGVGLYSNGYINISSTKIDDAYAININ